MSENRSRLSSGGSDTPRPRTGGDLTQQPAVQLALMLQMMLLSLLALWILWSLVVAA